MRQGMDILEECDVRNRLGGGVLRNFSLRKKSLLVPRFIVISDLRGIDELI